MERRFSQRVGDEKFRRPFDFESSVTATGVVTTKDRATGALGRAVLPLAFDNDRPSPLARSIDKAAAAEQRPDGGEDYEP